MIRGKRVTLKPFTREMYKKYYQWRLDEEVMYWACGEPYHSSIVSEETFMKRYEMDVLEDRYRETGILGIFTESDEFIGEVDYRKMDLISGSAVIGIMIGDKNFWGKGYGTDALRSMCKFLFQRFQLRRIQLDTWSGNERAMQSYMKIGFTVEGRLRQATLVEGVPTDQVVMGLLRSEFVPE